MKKDKQLITMISLQLPRVLAVKVRVLASQRNLSRSEWIRQALERQAIGEIEEKEKSPNGLQSE